MTKSDRFYIQKLHDCLKLKQQMNPQYSLRAFARDLDLDASGLSKIMTSKRPLLPATAKEIAEKLKLDAKEQTLFIESTHRYKPNIDDIKISPEDDRFVLDESYFSVIAEWEHYAVLTLFDIENFIATAASISERLGLNPIRTVEVIDNLVTCGLLRAQDDGTYLKTKSVVRTTEDYTSRALKASHLETLDLGKLKLEEIELELRDFSSSTLALDLEMLPEAKTIIREFRMKMASLLKKGKRNEVYQLAVQFYPLTKISKGK